MTWNHQVRVNQPRCLRHRYNKSTCSRCFNICETGAITFETELRLDEIACKSCMLCTSVCPTDALTIDGFSEYQVINTLAKADSPVLACAEHRNLRGHVLGPCLGHLSSEHLAAYQVLIGKPMQLNMVGCSECQNSHVTEVIEDRVNSLGYGSISIISYMGDLEFEEVAHSRRDLLGMLGIQAFRSCDTIVANKEFSNQDEPGFVEKTLPTKMHVLNLARESCTKPGKPTALDSHYFTVTIEETCDGCGACIALCPTGALVQVEDSIEFNNALCTGCGLCVEFCPLKSIDLNKAV